jgi:hypothetical protein
VFSEVAPAMSLRAVVMARATLRELDGGTSIMLNALLPASERGLWC